MKQPVRTTPSRRGVLCAVSPRLIALALIIPGLPCLLTAQTLQHRYSFVSDASDSVGSANGTLVPPGGGTAATISGGLNLPGGGGGGFSGYVSLPSGILTTTTNLTIEVWATQNSPNQWGTIWDFANDGNHNFELCPDPNRNNGDVIVAFTPNGGENDLNTPTTFPSGSEEYVAVTYNNSSLAGNIYYNGALDGTLTLPNASYCPGTIGGAGGTVDNWLGRDVYNDSQFQGTIYEFRIWNGAVSQRYIAASAVAGSSVLINNLTPTSVSITASPSVIITGTEQPTVTVQLPQTGTNELLATGDATNWTSSNPSVLAVNSNGVVTGVALGAATVRATVGGITGTSSTITVTGPQTLLHRYSFVSDATDSVGGANGTLVAPAVGGAATISNGLSLPGNQNGGFGYSGYVSLPSGILTNTTSLTVECWVTQNQGNGWAELWDFGNNGNQNFAIIPYPQNNGTHTEVAFTPNGGEHDLQSGVSFPNGAEQYVCLTYNNFSLIGDLYTNGTLVATTTFPNTTYCPGSIGGANGTTENMLGNDVYGDWQFSGTVYEFRIWNGALSPVYAAVSAAAGPGVVVTNLTPTSLSITVSNLSMIGAQTQPATVLGNFADASGVNVTSGATNWTSSNSSVLTVDNTGLITALSGGTATVSAKVNGVSATSGTISVADTAPNPIVKPANETVVVGQTAFFGVQALGGGLGYQWKFGATPIPGATNNTLVLPNVTFASAGIYSVLITNNIGSTNVSAMLTVVSQFLEHRYSFVSDASDSVGGANGTLVPPAAGAAATIANGLSLPGNTSGGFGYSGYVSLPPGILTNTLSLTIECWVTQNQGNTWAELWDFGNSGSQNFALIPYPANNGNNMEVAFTPHGNEIDLQSSLSFPNGSEQYVAVTYNNFTLTGDIYTNGALLATTTFPDSSYSPGSIGGASGTAENMLGNDVYGDYQFSGTLYEFRIWDGVVSPLYLVISAAAGPGVVVTNLTPTSVSVTVASTTMTGESTQPATVLGNFVDASGITVTSFATNWTSSNPSVLTVDTNGLITAVGAGSATISATVNGTTGTSASITVPLSAPVITVEPQPASTTVYAGNEVIFSAAAEGAPAPAYQWYQGPSPVRGATNASFSVVAVPGTTDYSVVATNSLGSATSSVVSVTGQVFVAPPTGFTINFNEPGEGAYQGLGVYDDAPSDTNWNVFAFTADQEATSGFAVSSDGGSTLVTLSTDYGFDNGILNPAYQGSPCFIVQYEAGVNSGNPGAGTAANPMGSFTFNDVPQGSYTLYVYSANYDGNRGSIISLAPVNHGVADNGINATRNVQNDHTCDTMVEGDNYVYFRGVVPDATGAIYGTYIANPAGALTGEGQIDGLQLTKVMLSIRAAGTNVIVTWSGGTLQSAPTLTSAWSTVAGTSPLTLPATGAARFFRVY
jgi:uncharacterized protein YjdB